MSVLDAIAAAGHEQVVLVADDSHRAPRHHRDPLDGARARARRRPLLALRLEEDALRDALRLSEAMTLKAAAPGLDQGGGKVVVMLRSGPPARRGDAAALGRAIDELGGRYIAAEDVGATERDMNWIALETPWVTGVERRRRRLGRPVAD